ncbi:MAG: TRAP transporter small permease subunit [Magnetovibrionaceae bacterium]
MPKANQFIIHALVQVGGWALMAAALLVTYDVITRKILGLSIAGADEISGYVFAVSTASAYSYALLTRANIRIDFIYNVLPEIAQRILDILAMVALAGFFAIVCYHAWNIVADAYQYDSRSITPLRTPLIIPQALWFAALCFALLTALTLLAVSILSLLKGDFAAVRSLIGIPSLDEEIAEEMGGHDASPKAKPEET